MPVLYIPHGGGPWPFMNLPPHLDHGPNLRPFLENIHSQHTSSATQPSQSSSSARTGSKNFQRCWILETVITHFCSITTDSHRKRMILSTQHRQRATTYRQDTSSRMCSSGSMSASRLNCATGMLACGNMSFRGTNTPWSMPRFVSRDTLSNIPPW